MKASEKVWLVTGCSSGFGRAMCEHLLVQGAYVIATARRTAELGSFAGQERALVLPLDVTDRAQCTRVVDAAIRRFGRIDVLINNAGIGYFGAVEETGEAAARRLFEVNFFGATNMIHAVLPRMRAKRSGTIVNLTSIGGLVGFTGVGYYCASKFALEGLSESLRTEVEPLGLRVMTVEPSGFRTDWAGASSETEDPIADYEPTAGAARMAYHASVGCQAGDPARAAQAIARAAASEQPPERLLLGNEAQERAIAKLAQMRSEFERWEEVARGADFPEAQRQSA